MSPRDSNKQAWLRTAAVVAVALVAGFGIAKLTTRPVESPPSKTDAPAVGPASMEVPASHIAAAGIALETVASGSLSAEILAPATVSSAPNGEAIVTAHAGGTVTRLNKRLGDAVRAGEVIATVESREAATMAADSSVAQTRLTLARTRAAREQQLFDQRVSPRQDLENARAELAVAEAEARRARTTATAARVGGDGRSILVASPLSGRITGQPVTLGAFVQPETELFRVADPRFVQIEASVTVIDAGRIAPGDTATLITTAGQTLSAVVRSVTPALDAQTRSATVVLSLAGAPSQVAPGEALQVRIHPKAGGPAGIVIPDEAVQSVEGRDVVFVRNAKGFVAQPVVVASRSGGRASIVSGLQAGQSIATKNAFLLKAQLTHAGEE
jgi:cobalt-zinc-cadmium efflux system membrane fusion protein